MKLGKSILGPVRATRNGGAVSLSFFSRRLRTSGSLKGGQRSPFFRKKRGGAFENHEPSSPKVTCIGQVRVKSKKKANLSTRRIGEVSFRKMEQQSHQPPPPPPQQQQQECLRHRNQRWVHLPISLCEALRAFGAEFRCLFVPCKRSCFPKKAEKRRRCADENGCGAVFARWLVSVNDAEGGQRREIELVVGGGEEAETAQRMTMRSSRRHVFDDIEVKDDRIEVKGGEEEEEEEEAARVSICIPPKNALLLMRCRSDPMKMADLAHRFSWDANAAPRYEDVDEEEINHVLDLEEQEGVRGVCEGEDKTLVKVAEENVAVSVKHNEEKEVRNEAEPTMEMEEKEQESLVEEEEKEEVESNMSSFEALLDQENTEQYEDCPIQVEESPVLLHSSDKEAIERNEVLPLPEESAMQKEKQAETKESTAPEKEINVEQKPEPAKQEQDEKTTALEVIKTPENQETAVSNREIKKEESPALPECLLLMMREPKLSMEVSKETWVCGTDFIRWLPERPRKAAKPTKTSGGCHHEQVKKKATIDPKPNNKPSLPPPPTKKNDLQPPRSSCSLPAASMANMIEQKLVKGGDGHEPSALTRCKSEPMRTAAAKLMPEPCSWKNASTKLEVEARVGAAGVGF
ncbi:hypothetical protein Salat_1989500 [Sesamum alatum]|uniref:Uncharacterized protein n=1 Tax=Sesamum alatum TaxID=300844 RepID=A0AAE2CFM9_9LAMI|nr:hypothetical protein Salat_1989500 [Sesamum alatum]